MVSIPLKRPEVIKKALNSTTVSIIAELDYTSACLHPSHNSLWYHPATQIP
jgi:hypothetical protein